MSWTRTLCRGLIAAACVAPFLAGAPAFATSFVRMSDEALLDQTPLVAEVEVLTVDDSIGAAGGTGALTEYTMRIDALLKGEAPGATVRVRVLGGQGPGGERLKIFGAPTFGVGDTALVFLAPNRDGTFHFKHFFLGAFHLLQRAEGAVAYRNLADVTEVKAGASGLSESAGDEGEEPRDLRRFAAWIRSRAAGRSAAADYFVPASAAIRAAVPKYTFISNERFRWTSPAGWRAHSSGQPGVSGGGFAEFQSALAAWTADPGSNIGYSYLGTTASQAGLTSPDGINAILFNDPNGEIDDDFNCGSGGVLAIGGPWSDGTPVSYNGFTWNRISEGDIVTNDGLACFFGGANGSTSAAELFTHELGHTLGLGHSCGDGFSPSCANATYSQAVMRAYVHADGRGAALGSDDQAGVACIYGASCGVVQTVPAAPTGLTATAVSAAQIQLAWSDNANNETAYRVEVKPAGEAYSLLTTLGANSTSVSASGLNPASTYAFRVQALGAAGSSGYSNEASATTQNRETGGGSCAPSATSLCLDGGRFRVAVAWRRASGQTGAGTVVPALTTADSGVFWFFAASNWEMLVKVLNGCGVNGRHWVFFGAATDQAFTLTVTDTQTGQVRNYANGLGNVSPIYTDTNAFATCP